ncbi:hypothetical protein H5T87_06110 [bacterium]|nr:hypothetical protein [bacterium]
MRKFMTFFLFLCLVCPFAWSFLTVYEAEQAIREFEGIPGLQLKYVGLSTEQFGSDEELIECEVFSPVPWPCYLFETDYPDRLYDRYYTVEPFTGKVLVWGDAKLHDAEPSPSSVDEMLTPQEIYNLAVNYIKTRICDSFEPSQYQVKIFYGFWKYFIYNPDNPQPWPTSTEPRSAIEVHFTHYVTDGAGDRIIDHRAYFSLLIGACTGNLIKFYYRYFPIDISLVADIGFDEAREIALDSAALLNPPPTYAEVRLLGKGIVFTGDVPPDCISYVWGFNIMLYYSGDGERSPHRESWDLNVDAHTGEVWWLWQVLGSSGDEPTREKIEEFKKISGLSKKMQSKWNWKAVIRNGDVSLFFPYLDRNKFYIRVEQAWLFAVSTKEEGKNVVLEHKGKKTELTSKVILRRNGKTYVPLDEVLKLAGYSARYVPKEKTIYIEKKNEKKKEHKVQ